MNTVISSPPWLCIESVDPQQSVALKTSGRFVIGRGAVCDLPLNDPTISRQHCVVAVTDAGFEVQDLGSQGGTFVNEQVILGAVILRDGDRIRIGNTVLRFVSGMNRSPLEQRLSSQIQKTPEPADPDQTLVRRPGQPASSAPAPLQTEKSIPLGPRIVLGRDPQCDVPLPCREISRRHAEILREQGGYTVRDLSSANGTFLNGLEVRGRMALTEGSRLRVGPYSFLVRNHALWPSCQKGNVRIALQQITKTVASRDTGQTLTLLDDVSLVIEPNEFVALLGSSGSGKSTLMDAINGRRPASSGRVLVNEDDFYQTYSYYRRAIGYVPQKDIVHATLTVEQAFCFTARLRLPPDTSEPEMHRIVDEVIQQMGLAERRQTLIGNLSGGQLKRVSLGVELIADPNLLFLDEATSGLDAGTEAKMMRLFRDIANEGKTVVCITHNVENINLCDTVVVLAKGQLVYYGPPSDLPAFFGVETFSEVYDKIESRPSGEWAERYRTSLLHEQFVTRRMGGVKPQSNSRDPARVSNGTTKQNSVPAGGARQWSILTQRYLTLMMQDRRNAALLLAQAPLIAILLGMVFGRNISENDSRMLLFLMTISAIWFGCINACREIVKELPIYLRERAVNLELLPYLGSKVAVLSGLCAAQCLALYVIAAVITSLPGAAVPQFLALFLTSVCGMLMGLLVSALVSSADKAMAVIPILLIPQVIFADVITPLGDGVRFIAQWCVVAFWSVDALLNTLPTLFGIKDAQYGGGVDALVLCLMAGALAGLAALALKRKDTL
jgi:ABC-type multidrug transport system ATPase subunit